jgi:glutamate-1-semialdehyde 2,1-aminomutase
MSTYDYLKVYQEKTQGSLRELKKAEEVLPLGVGSTFRRYLPYPMVVEKASGSKLWDVDGNEYIDFNLCYGALIVGHSHPKIVETLQQQASRGTLYGMPHKLNYELAKIIVEAMPIDMVRFANSGTEATMHAIRLARGYTGKNKIIKMEGGYHGAHDYVLVSTKPPRGKIGKADAPTPVLPTAGIPKEAVAHTLVAQFNDLDSVKRLLEQYPYDVAAVIVEPVMMNLTIAMPDEGFFQKLLQLCREYGTLLIFDEVKTGFKLGRGGACEYFNIKPDIICLAKSFGGGMPIAAFGARREIMQEIESKNVLHAGTYSANPLCVAVALVTLREILTDEAYKRIFRLNKMLVEGCDKIIKEHKLPAVTAGAGANGCVVWLKRPVRNYRDYLEVNDQLFKAYWFGMFNRGIIAQPAGKDEQWTISVQHTEEDIKTHIQVFEEVAKELK